MAIRTRNRATPVIGYYTDRFNSDSRTVYTLEQTTVDTTPSPGGMFFNTYKRESIGGLINGGPTGDFWNSHWQDFPVLAASGKRFPFQNAAYGSPPLDALGAQLLARTNPSKPSVDLPSFVGELADLPHLFKVAGDTLLKKGASLNLNYQFGWRPLINDLFTMLQFQQAAEKRFKQLKKMQSDGVLKSTINLWSGSWSSVEENFPLETYAAFIYATVNEMGTTNIRGHVKWFPDAGALPQTDKEIFDLAVRAVTGLYHSPASFWEVMPWSWAIDWFTNVGDLLNAQRNLISCTHSPCEIMTHTVVVTSTDPPSTNYYTVSGLTVREEYKTRDVTTPSLTAYLPALTGSQLSILGSIGILRR